MSRSKSEITTLQGTVSRLQSDITDRDTVIQIKEATDKRKDSELEAKSRALGEKDATLSAMSEQITKTREYLATKQQVSNYQLFAGRLVSPNFLYVEIWYRIDKINS